MVALPKAVIEPAGRYTAGQPPFWSVCPHTGSQSQKKAQKKERNSSRICIVSWKTEQNRMRVKGKKTRTI